MFKDNLVDGDDVVGRNRNDDNHSSPPPILYTTPKVLLLTLRRSSVGVTKTVKLTSEIQEGKGRIVTQGRREGGGEG